MSEVTSCDSPQYVAASPCGSICVNASAHPPPGAASSVAAVDSSSPNGRATRSVPDGLVGIAFSAMAGAGRSEEHTSELQSLMRISYAVFCLQKKTIQTTE